MIKAHEDDDGDVVPDVYADQFSLFVGPYGATLYFGVAEVIQPGPDPAPPTPPLVETNPVATVRMSLEHLKAMTWAIHAQIARYQSEFGVTIGFPDVALQAIGATREQWQKFWGES